jgi:outer membrane immunogenic protein
MRLTSESNRGKNAGGAKLSKLDKADNRLRQFIALAFALCAGAPSAALAADFPAPIRPPVYKEPPVIYNWTGFYIGGNIAAAWQGLSGTNFSDTIGSTFTAPTNVQFMGGGQLGVNYQFSNSVVIGAEAMFDWLPSTQNAQITATAPDGTAAFFGTINNRWLTTATGRLGYAWDRVLLYGKAGGAWVGANSLTIAIGGGAPANFASVSNTNSFGYTAGFGLEWAFWNNWSLRAEYDYIGLGNRTYTVAPGPTIFGGDVITYNYPGFSIMTLAVNYKFGGW